MKAHEMTFGVEIECYMTHDAVAQVGGYHRPIGTTWLPAGWGAQGDGSLNSAPTGMRGVEFVSPILSGKAGFEQVVKVVREIKARGGVVNATCGLHVHVGFNKHNYHVLAHLISLIANHEKAIYASTGTKNRERGTYSKGIKQYNRPDSARRRSERDRYHVLNLATGYKPTIEVRAFAGTLNAIKIVAAIGLCLGVVEKAFDRHINGLRHANWNQRTVGTPQNEGRREVERLLKALGWVGATPAATGMLYGETEAEKATMLRNAVKVLRQMADRYDAQS